MIMDIYAIKDKKVRFMSLFTQANEEIAKRNFKNTVNATEMKLDPADFELWKLGTYNDLTGYIEPESKFIISAAEVIRNEKND